jgi:simple sugar transport system ATP-binding protein
MCWLYSQHILFEIKFVLLSGVKSLRGGKELLRFEHIEKDFFGNKVLEDINLVLHEGEVLGLVGENGAGKSTMMKILFGMPEIHETGGYKGKIIFEGKEVDFNSPLDALDNGIGMVHQEFSLLPGFTATENIVLNRESTKYNFLVEIFGDRIKTLDFIDMEKRAKKAIDHLGVNLDPKMLVAEMPVGHKQFTEIAREIERENTKLLVLDEPTAVLTESEADILLETIKRLSNEGIAIIFITHRLSEILEVADKVAVLRDGHLIKEVPIEEADEHKITEWMIGRNLEKFENNSVEDRKFGNTILKVKNLMVDMPGEFVRNVSFEVKEGEIFGIGGLAGQGKLGIPNGIMGLFYSEGEVEFNGEKLSLNNPLEPLNKGIAFVSEDRRGVGLLLDESIELNITFTAMQIRENFIKKWLFLKLRDENKMSEVAKEYIEKLQIKCVSEKQKVKELSGGNQQKVCLARAFVMNPKLLFVSEPTRGIDVGAKKLVLDVLKQYNREYGTTIIITSSELEELRSICDRIAIISEGTVSGILPAKESSIKFGELMVKRVEVK